MSQNIDAILIDDDPLILETWAYYALKKNINLIKFSSHGEFFNSLNVYNFPFSTIIYIDSNLGYEIKGELVAKNIYDLGFHTIFLISGIEKYEFSKELYWLKDILGKNPPW